MASWTNQSKNTASWTKQDRKGVAEAGNFDVATFDNSSFETTTTELKQEWVKYIRRGKIQTMDDLDENDFKDLALLTGQLIEEASFDELSPTQWTNQTKN